MDLTESYRHAFPRSVLDRYRMRETRNAAAILRATDTHLFDEISYILDEFDLRASDLLTPGGQELRLAQRFNQAFRARGWREVRVDTTIELKLRIMPYRPSGESRVTERVSSVTNPGYKVDNFKRRIALDLEWNAKDGNLDRDIAAYRAMYDAGLIDAAVLVTRTHDDLHDFATQLRLDHGMDEVEAKKMLAVLIGEVG